MPGDYWKSTSYGASGGRITTYSKTAAGLPGSTTRASVKEEQIKVKNALTSIERVIGGSIERLLGSQTGATGFTLKNILTASGSAGATARVLTFEGDDGTTYYVDGSESYS